MLDTNDHDIDFDGDFGADFGVDSNASLGLMASPFSPRFGMTSNELDQAISELGACLSPLAARSVPDFPDTGSDGVDFSLEHLDESDLFSDVGICDTDIITADPGPIGEESSAEGRALNGPPQLVPSVTFSLSHQLSGSCQEIVCPHVSPEGVLSVGVLNYGVGKAKAAANDVSVDDHCTTQVRTDRSIVCVIFRVDVAVAEADNDDCAFCCLLGHCASGVYALSRWFAWSWHSHCCSRTGAKHSGWAFAIKQYSLRRSWYKHSHAQSCQQHGEQVRKLQWIR